MEREGRKNKSHDVSSLVQPIFFFFSKKATSTTWQKKRLHFLGGYKAVKKRIIDFGLYKLKLERIERDTETATWNTTMAVAIYYSVMNTA